MATIRSLLSSGAILLALSAFMGVADVPDLVDGVPTSDAKETDSTFNARIGEAFPPGTKVESIIEHLEDQGFSVDGKHGYAIFEERAVSCNRRWMVRWSRKKGVVIQAEGKTGYLCR